MFLRGASPTILSGLHVTGATAAFSSAGRGGGAVSPPPQWPGLAPSVSPAAGGVAMPSGGVAMPSAGGVVMPSGRMVTAAAAPPVLVSDFLTGSWTLPAPLFLIVLNYNIPRAAVQLWQQAEFRICADGGANQLFDMLPSFLPDEEPLAVRRRFLPDAIAGDMDSIRPDVLQFYSSLGVPVHDLSSDQDSTDLTKCVQLVKARALPGVSGRGSRLEEEDHQILAIGALGGRLDHTLANLNTLHMFPGLKMALWGEGNLARLLWPGRTTIRPHPILEGPSCALVPLRGPATASSSGLRWNVAKTKMLFGGLISTSNILDTRDGLVEVDTDAELVWTTQVSC